MIQERGDKHGTKWVLIKSVEVCFTSEFFKENNTLSSLKKNSYTKIKSLWLGESFI